MGVYSELAAQKINEQNALENFQFSDLLEFAINIEKSDQAMFDAMLEMDFHEAYVEKGLISLNEGEKIDAAKAAVGKVWEKIVTLLRKFDGLIKTLVAKFTNKMAELSGKNKQLVDKIKDLDKAELSKKLEGTDFEVTALNVDVPVDLNKIDALEKIYENVKNGSESNPDEAVKEILSKLDTYQYFTKVDLAKWVDSNDLTALKNSVSDPQKEVNDVIGKINNLKKKVEADIGEFEKKASAEGASDENRADAMKKIAGFNAVMKGFSKLISFVINYYARKVACDRAIYSKLGAVMGVKLDAKDKVEQAKNVANDAKEGAKDVAGKVKDTVDKVVGGKGKLATEAVEELEYKFMAIDVMNETYIEELFA